jgi:hypothetical protein
MITKRNSNSISSGNASPVDPERHSRTCAVCNSAHREAIEEAFLHWLSPESIRVEYNVNRFSLYRHAHAMNLFALRRRNYRAGLEHVIERASSANISGDAVVRAVRTCVRFDDEGNWSDPIHRIVVSRASDPIPVPQNEPGQLRSPAFLTATPNQVEIDVTATKQSTETDSNRNKITVSEPLREPSVIHKSW